MNLKNLFGLLSFLAIVGCNQQKTSPAEPSETRKLTVSVVNYPLYYFTDRIGGESIKVNFPVPVDVDPSYWIPGLEELTEFQQSDLILLNGAGYAQWVSTASLPASRIVNTSHSFKDRYIFISGQATHSHGPEGEHLHGEMAFITWLDPLFAIQQADAVHLALSEMIPDQKEIFSERFQVLKKDLLNLDKEIASLVSKYPDRALIFSHPVYHYLIKRYNLDGYSLHWEPDQVPEGEMWHNLEHLLSSRPATWMVWEETPLSETSEKLKAIGIECVVFNTCANKPGEGDYLSVMKQNVRNLRIAFH